MEIIAKDGRRFVTGEAGQSLLKDMIPTQAIQFGRK